MQIGGGCKTDFRWEGKCSPPGGCCKGGRRRSRRRKSRRKRGRGTPKASQKKTVLKIEVNTRTPQFINHIKDAIKTNFSEDDKFIQ